MIRQALPQFDDETIAGTETLLRICKTSVQVTKNKLTGEYILSDQVFSALHGGCSVEFISLIEAAGETPQLRGLHHRAFALVTITVSGIREVEYQSGKQKLKGLKVAYTPLSCEQPGGPNEFHGDIFPSPSGSAKKALCELMEIEMAVDQQAAAIAYAKRVAGR